MRPGNNALFTAVTAQTNQNSVAQWAWDMVRVSFQLVATGTAAGTLQAQASNDSPYGSGYNPNQFQPTNWFNVGSATTVSGSGAYGIAELETSYEYVRLAYTSTATGVQTIVPIADTGVKQVQTVTTAPDVTGSLNSTYFLLSSVNVSTKAQKNFYVWFNINSAGVDPAIAGRTAIPITGATNVSANTLATSIRSALNALTNDFVATGSNASVIITNVAFGPVTAAADGTAATGFTFGAATAGVASNLNNTYFLIQDASTAHSFYTWFNVDSIGTDPVIAGRTAAPVAISSGSSAATVGTALATELTSLNSTNSFSATGTTTVTVTMHTSGPFVPATDGSVPTGFTFAVTTPTGTVSSRIKFVSL